MIRGLLLVGVLAGCALPLQPSFEGNLVSEFSVFDAGQPAAPDAGARRLCADAGWVSLTGFLPRAEMGVATLGHEVFAAGGYDLADYVVNTVEAYSWVTDSWRTVAPLPRKLNHVNLIGFGGKLYALGALNPSFVAIPDSWAWDPATNVWTAIASMPSGTQRGASAIVATADRIFVIGGLRNSSVTDVSSYDPATDTWTTLPSLPAARDHLMAAVAADGTLFAIGGRRNYVIDGRVDALAPGASAWVSKTAMLTPRAGSAATTVGTKVIILGGEGNRFRQDGIFQQVESYDLATDTWEALPMAPTSRHGTGGATVDGVAFFPGGAIVEGSGATGVNEAYCP